MRTENGFGIASWTASTLTATGSATQMCPASAIQTITALAYSGNYATATCAGHGYTLGETVQVNGASDSNFNGSQTIYALTTNTFSYYMPATPSSTAGTPTVATFKVNECLVLADSGNSQTVTIGPDSNATSRPLSAGQEYTIPQVTLPQTGKVKIDLATWYMISASGSQTLRLLWILWMAMAFIFFLSPECRAQGGYNGVQQAVAGSGVTITPATGVGVITISSSGGGGGATNGIQQLNGFGTNTTLTNAILYGNGAGLTNFGGSTNSPAWISVNGKIASGTLIAGANITFAPGNNSLTIASSGGGGFPLTSNVSAGNYAITNVSTLGASNGTFTGNQTIGGTLGVTGAVALNSTLNVANSAAFSSTVSTPTGQLGPTNVATQTDVTNIVDALVGSANFNYITNATTNLTVTFGSTNIYNRPLGTAQDIDFSAFAGTQGPQMFFIVPTGTNINVLWPTNTITELTNNLVVNGSNYVWTITNAPSAGMNILFTEATNYANNSSLTNVFVEWWPAPFGITGGAGGSGTNYLPLNNNWTGSNNFSSQVVATNASNTFTGAFTGNGNGLTNMLVSIFIGQVNINFSSTALNFAGLAGAASATSATTNAAVPLPSGTLKQLRVRTPITMSSGTNLVATIYTNGVATSITCTIASPNFVASDLTHSAVINDGDLVSILWQSNVGGIGTGNESWSLEEVK
jgi:hypothetical protein